MIIDVERMDEDGLARARWRFGVGCDYGFRGLELTLDEYHLEHRETRRKQLWEKDKVYMRVGDVRPFRDEQVLKAADVPLPPDVEKELRDGLVEFVRAVGVTRKERR